MLKTTQNPNQKKPAVDMRMLIQCYNCHTAATVSAQGGQFQCQVCQAVNIFPPYQAPAPPVAPPVKNWQVALAIVGAIALGLLMLLADNLPTKKAPAKDPDIGMAKGAALLETRRTAHDPDSIDVQDCSAPKPTTDDCWVSTCTVRGKNAFGAMVASVKSFSMCRHGEDWKVTEL